MIDRLLRREFWRGFLWAIAVGAMLDLAVTVLAVVVARSA